MPEQGQIWQFDAAMAPTLYKYHNTLGVLYSWDNRGIGIMMNDLEIRYFLQPPGALWQSIRISWR
jgi:hypothetical protein